MTRCTALTRKGTQCRAAAGAYGQCARHRLPVDFIKVVDFLKVDLKKEMTSLCVEILVYLEGTTIPMGSVDGEPTVFLSDLRIQLEDELAGVLPEKWVFVKDSGAPFAPRQEARRSAGKKVVIRACAQACGVPPPPPLPTERDQPQRPKQGLPLLTVEELQKLKAGLKKVVL